ILITPPAIASSEPAVGDLEVATDTTDDQGAGTKDEGELLQFTSSGHILGFSRDNMIIASASHMLRIDFLDSRAVAPQADSGLSTESSIGAASPLGKVTYQDIWDGVTLVYEAAGVSIVKSTYYVDTTVDGTQVDRIRLGYNRPVQIDERGNLIIAYDDGTMVESAPIAWQEIEGQRMPVTAAYTLYGDREVGFSIGDYIPGIPVIIDPEVTWNTFLGGGGNDYGLGIAVDSSGNVYITGYSNVAWGSPLQSHSGGYDAFVAKLDGSGTLTWNTFLGSSVTDKGYGIAVDGSGNVYVAGESLATWGGSPVQAHSGGYDAFAAKLNGSGSLTWNTFLGSDSGDTGYGIAVDGSGNVYVTGNSGATWGTPERAYSGGDDAFAAELDSSGTLTWNTFLGSSATDHGYGIAVDGSGNVYVTGDSGATWGTPVRAYSNNGDAFAAKLNGSGNLTWNTFLGGSSTDNGNAIAVDSSGNVYVTGNSGATWGTPERAYTSNGDAFAAKLNGSGSLTWNTFLGGSSSDYGNGLAVDGSGNVYVTGNSLATWGSPLRAYTSNGDAFTAKLNGSGNLSWNTFLGGSSTDNGLGIAVYGSGNVYVTGYSNGTWGVSPVRAYSSNADAFADKLDYTAPTAGITYSPSGPYKEGDSITITATFSEEMADSPVVQIVMSGAQTLSATNMVKTDPTHYYYVHTVVSGDGTATISLSTGTDLAENMIISEPTSGSTFTVDTTPPSVELTSTATSPTSTSPIPMTATFSEAVTGFALGDITVDNGTPSALAGGPTVYTFDVTPAGQGWVTVDIDAGVAQDWVGHGNIAADQFYINYDSIGPGVILSSTATSPTETSPIPMTADFDEEVTGFTLGDITVGNGTASAFVEVSPIYYTFNVTPTGDGEVTVDIAASVAQDEAGNGNTAADQFSITYDGEAPSVVLTSTATSPTSTSPIPMTATFSEAVTGFHPGDITVGNGTRSNFAGGPIVYTFDVTPAGDGEVTVDIAAGVAQDVVGHGNTAADQFSILYDGEAPGVTLSSTATSHTNTSPIPMTATFSEVVTGFTLSDITVGNGTKSNFAGGPIVYTFDVTPAGQGEVTVDIGAGVAHDIVGKGNTAADQFSIIYDIEAPGVVLT
ncbi:Ig-like domain-containing protein, partial [Chloroflexota bacterium]